MAQMDNSPHRAAAVRSFLSNRVSEKEEAGSTSVTPLFSFTPCGG